MNKVVLVGRLSKEPELTFTPGTGTAICKFNVAVDRKFSKDKEREADFIPIVVWGKQGEACANYTAKGKLIGISGRIQTRNYEAKDGHKVYVTEIIAEEVQFIEWSKKPGEVVTGIEGPGDGMTPVGDGDIPF